MGASIAGFGVGVLFADRVPDLAWPAVIAGVAVHLFGMVGAMRLQSAVGYEPSNLERMGYWLCWAMVAALLGYAMLEWVR